MKDKLLRQTRIFMTYIHYTYVLCSVLVSFFELYDTLMNLLQRACVLGRRCAVCVIPHSCGGPAQGQSSRLTCYWISCMPCAHSTGIMPGSICYPSVPSKKQGVEVLCSINHMDIFPFLLIIYTGIYFAAIIVFIKNFKGEDGTIWNLMFLTAVFFMCIL